MQLNLSKMPITLHDVFKLSTYLDLHIPRRLLDVNIAYYALLNHGSKIGLVSILPRCRPYNIIIRYYVKSVFNDKITGQDIIDLVCRKFKPNYVVLDNKLFTNNFSVNHCRPSKRNWDVDSFVGLLIIDKNKNVLSTYRCDFCMWSIPTGKIEEDEKPVEAVKREALEELKLYNINVNKVLTVTTPNNNLLIIYKYVIHDWNEITNVDDEQPVLNIVPLSRLKFVNKKSFTLKSITESLDKGLI